MTINATKTVKELVIALPAATLLFERLGIDYCCGGGKTLQDACQAAGLNVDEVVNSLATIAPAETDFFIDWENRPLAELAHYIIDKHHSFTSQSLTEITALLAKVNAVHGKNHAELQALQDLFAALSQELMPHMLKEERVLFPYIVKLEQANIAQMPMPTPQFGNVNNPINRMMQEHENAGEILVRMRVLSSNYNSPADGCASFRTLYQMMAALESDLHQHIHLENNILFPRAARLENINNSCEVVR
jgi:regulator of cell morphogenesis and NO signaling